MASGPERTLPAVTYSAQEPRSGPTLRCKRCGRTHEFPLTEASRPVRCECGWWYSYRHGALLEEFRPRLDG